MKLMRSELSCATKIQLITFNKIPFDHHIISIRIKITEITDKEVTKCSNSTD